MSDTQIRYHIHKTIRRYLALRTTEITLLGLSAGLITFTLVQFFTNHSWVPWTLAALVTISCVIIRCIQLRLFDVDEDSVIRYVNRTYPQLQQSGDLLLEDNSRLTMLQQLQKLKSIEQFEQVYPVLKLPHNLKQAVIVIAVSIPLFIAGSLIYSYSVPEKTDTITGNVTPPEKQSAPTGIKSSVVLITPPSYTGQHQTTQQSLNLNIIQGSKVNWTFSFEDVVDHVRLILYGKDTISMTKNGGTNFTVESIIQNTGFYQIAWNSSAGQTKYSDYFQFDVSRDLAPIIKVTDLDQFIELALTDNLKVDLKTTITDDYGLQDAYIIATVSKGSGEAIKFREEKLRFSRPSSIRGKAVDASMKIDLVKLGLDPGDELYFYVEALDNKTPQSNHSRTETYFISLQDTTEISTSVDPGLGVDLMPEYFRSQRQIIIDTEKLLKSKNTISKESFKSKSNELGHDEKVLRLRYGEFLGEEFETSIGPVAGPDGHDDGNDEDVSKKYGHQHDTEKEHESAEPATHSHSDAKGNTKEDPAKEYMHEHDSEEEATFFDRSIRAKLKAAVTIMWDAELYLRLYEPEKSLPFQYKALKLLKEISQDSRIYVHRTGFDPPPLKEEKRLTGELTEMKSSTEANDLPVSESYPNIRLALHEFAAIDSRNAIHLTEKTQALLLKAGNELSAVALANPGRYLKSLSLIKAISSDELEPDERTQAINEIRSAFYSVLPQHAYSAQSKQNTGNAIDDQFLKNLERLQKN